MVSVTVVSVVAVLFRVAVIVDVPAASAIDDGDTDRDTFGGVLSIVYVTLFVPVGVVFVRAFSATSLMF